MQECRPSAAHLDHSHCTDLSTSCLMKQSLKSMRVITILCWSKVVGNSTVASHRNRHPKPHCLVSRQPALAMFPPRSGPQRGVAAPSHPITSSVSTLAGAVRSTPAWPSPGEEWRQEVGSKRARAPAAVSMIPPRHPAHMPRAQFKQCYRAGNPTVFSGPILPDYGYPAFLHAPLSAPALVPSQVPHVPPPKTGNTVYF